MLEPLLLVALLLLMLLVELLLNPRLELVLDGAAVGEGTEVE
jgi:hypothetical protein